MIKILLIDIGEKYEKIIRSTFTEAVTLAFKKRKLIQGDRFQPSAYLQSFDGKLYLLNIGFPDYKKPMPLSESLFFNQSFRVIATPEDAIIK
jgi:hypothetical protein